VKEAEREDDDDLLFFKSLLPDMKTLPPCVEVCGQYRYWDFWEIIEIEERGKYSKFKYKKIEVFKKIMYRKSFKTTVKKV
jgi:hypothetical protein